MAVNGTITKGFKGPKQHFGHRSAPVAAGTAGGTIRAGDVVMDNGSGVIIVATADQTNTLLGVALNAATSGNEVRFWMALPGVIFEATLEDETNESHALAATNLWGKYAVQVDPGGSTYHYIDENDASNYSVVITRFVDAAATVRGRVECMFVKSAFIA